MDSNCICECGNYMHRPRMSDDGVARCSACHAVRTRTVLPTARLRLSAADCSS